MTIDFAIPVNHDLEAGLEAWREKAKVAILDYGFHMAITKWTDKVHACKSHACKWPF